MVRVVRSRIFFVVAFCIFVYLVYLLGKHEISGEFKQDNESSFTRGRVGYIHVLPKWDSLCPDQGAPYRLDSRFQLLYRF